MTGSLGATQLQTNKSSAPANSVLLDIPSCQSAPTHASLFCMWESEESMCNNIHNVFGRRHWGQTWNWDDLLRTDRSQMHLNHFLSLFRLFNAALIQNLSRLHSTEVTHFHSTRLVPQKEHLTLEKFLHSLIERMYIAQPLRSSTVAAACPHRLVIHSGKALHSQQSVRAIQDYCCDFSWSKC